MDSQKSLWLEAVVEFRHGSMRTKLLTLRAVAL
jgi:hypothetical protein